MNAKISPEIYEKILEYSVISAVDIVIYNGDGRVLLAKRTQEPCRGQWWIPGGRQVKGEMPEQTAIRKVREEIGLEIKIEKLIAVEDTIFDKTAFENVKTGVHYLSRIYLAKHISGKINLDNTQSECKWFDGIDDSFHPYVRKAIMESGIFAKILKEKITLIKR